MSIILLGTKKAICTEEYDVSPPADSAAPDRRPCLSLVCCHSLCQACAKRWAQTSTGRGGICPFCKRHSAFPVGATSNLGRFFNHLTMRLLLLYKESHKSTSSAAAAVSSDADPTETASFTAAFTTYGVAVGCDTTLARTALGSNANQATQNPPPFGMRAPPRPMDLPGCAGRNRNASSRAASAPFSSQQPSPRNPTAPTHGPIPIPTQLPLQDPSHPNNVPENSNRLFRLVSERRWDEASEQARIFPFQARVRFTSRGLQVTLVHAAVHFDAPFLLVQQLVQIDPPALQFRAWFQDTNLYLLPVDWARNLNRSPDLIRLLQPPNLPFGPFG